MTDAELSLLEDARRIINHIELRMLPHFKEKKAKIDRDLYLSDLDSQLILDGDINIIIMGIVDLCTDLLRLNKRDIPPHYKDRILACHEFLGIDVLTLAPLAKSRNEVVHKYLEMNWKNIVAVWTKLDDISLFLQAARALLNRSLE